MTLANEKYLSLVTFRRNGEPVPTAVWVAQVGDELGVITEEHAGKVKRIRNNPRVTLTPCDVKGKELPGATTTAATARLVLGSDAVGVDQAIRKKYGLAYRAISLTWVLPALWARLRGKGDAERDFAILIKV
ncbi:MAG: PPOX class F420-dependent oxidoreductase [Ilumatobacteraceae bacterium]